MSVRSCRKSRMRPAATVREPRLMTTTPARASRPSDSPDMIVIRAASRSGHGVATTKQRWFTAPLTSQATPARQRQSEQTRSRNDQPLRTKSAEPPVLLLPKSDDPGVGRIVEVAVAVSSTERPAFTTPLRISPPQFARRVPTPPSGLTVKHAVGLRSPINRDYLGGTNSIALI